MKDLAILILLIFATGCTSMNVYRNTEFDKSPSTVAIAAGTSNISTEIKKIFKRNGFKIISADGGSVRETLSDGKTVVTAKNSYKYLMDVKTQWLDWCITGTSMVRFNINFINYETGEEIFSMSGRNCENDIISRINEELGFHE